MDNEIKQALDAMEDRIIARLDARFGQIETRFEQTSERIHDTETRILRAFHGWGRATDTKLRELPLLNERIVGMEERITELERKILEQGF